MTLADELRIRMTVLQATQAAQTITAVTNGLHDDGLSADTIADAEAWMIAHQAEQLALHPADIAAALAH